MEPPAEAVPVESVLAAPPVADLPAAPAPAPAPAPPLEPPRHAPAFREPRTFSPASPAAVQGAIEEVSRIIETLRAAHDEMEEVLETLELAERQKTADEQEIETLRRGLRHMNRPQEGGHHQRRH